VGDRLPRVAGRISDLRRAGDARGAAPDAAEQADERIGHQRVPQVPRVSRGRKHVLACLALFAAAFTLRRYYFSGLVLGDDGQEYAVLTYILRRGYPMFTDQLHLRFGWWVPNYLSFLLFGVSETTFMLAQWVTSSTLGIVAYAILISLGYGVGQAFLGGLFVCSAPFEVLIGTTHANDLYLGWAFAV